MSQTTAWLCIQAQTELAHLTNTLPIADSYDALKAVIDSKVCDVDQQNATIHDCLQRRGVRLTTAAAPSASQSATTASSSLDERKPIVVFMCDIEGTTTPLPFVRKVMRPLAASYVATYAKAHFPQDAAFVQHVRDAAAYVASTATSSAAADAPSTPAPPPLAAAFDKCEAAHFGDAAANDALCALFCEHFKEEGVKGSKESYMKAVEGAIWGELYAKGAHQTQVFPDVDEFFRFAGSSSNSETWRIALYSTGSVEAQKLLMRHTPYGDLNPFVTAYFDPTVVGTKLTPKSYMRIRNMLAEQLNIASPEQLQIVFVTDNASEASAADSSGAIDCPVLCMRPLNEWIKVETLLSVSLPFITSFAQLIRPKEKVDYNQLVRDTMNALKE